MKMILKILAIGILVEIFLTPLLAPLLRAQFEENPAEQVQTLKQALVKLEQQGIDPQSPKFITLRNKVSLMKSLANQISEKEKKSAELQEKINNLKNDAENLQPEIERLSSYLVKEASKLDEEMQRCDNAADTHNKNNRVFKLPEEEEQLKAYNAEAQRLDQWHKDIILREKVLADGPKSQRLQALTASLGELNYQIEELIKQGDNNLKDDLRAFYNDMTEIGNLMADLAKPLGTNHVVSLPDQGAMEQLLEVDKQGGRRFDTPGLGGGASYSPPPEVQGSPAFQEITDQQNLVDDKIMELKVKVFDPQATPTQIQTAVKKMQELESIRVGLHFQKGLIESPDSLPARRSSRAGTIRVE